MIQQSANVGVMCFAKASPDVVSAQQRRDAEQVFITFQHSRASLHVCKNLLGQWDFYHKFYLTHCLHTCIHFLTCY